MDIVLFVIFIFSLCRGFMNLHTSNGLILCDLKKDVRFLPKALKQMPKRFFEQNK